MNITNEHIVNPHLLGEAFYFEGNRVGILLVHGFTATTAEVRPLAITLNSEGYTVAGPLLPGHNTEPNQLNQVTWQDWINEVVTSYKKLLSRCEIVYVGGESTGGLLALALGVKYPAIAGILAYAPALKLNINVLDMLKIYVMAPFIQYVNKKNMDSDDLWQGYDVIPLRGTLELIKLQRYVLPMLSKIHQPILIIQGKEDTTVHPTVPDLIYRKVNSPYKEKHWMAESAHCVILDKELSEVANLTLHFLSNSMKLAQSEPNKTR